MNWLLILSTAIPLAAVLLWLVWRPLRRLGREIQVERARELFLLQRERLEAKFVTAAGASGKPRGLRWKACEFGAEVAFARERRTGNVAALVGVTIRFEAVAGSDMEGLPAVNNLRDASAVFYFQRGHWETVGRTIFNMNPAQAVAHFHNQYELVAAAPPR
jgi:hypothetical protein